MGQKVHPTGFRLGIIRRHNSTWFANFKDYSRDLEEDYKIRRFFDKSNPDKFFNISTRKESEEIYALASIIKVEIHRSYCTANNYYNISVIVHALQPEFILKIESYLRISLSKIVSNKRQSTHFADYSTHNISIKPKICIKTIKVPTHSIQSVMIARSLGEQLEKRIRYRRALRLIKGILKKSGVKDFKLQIAGRLDGVAIARTEWMREGRVPLHTIKADIDYACHRANTKYGVIGIKVWIFKGEVDHLAETRYWY